MPKTNTTTDPQPAFGKNEATAIGTLANALGGLTTAIRDVASGWALQSPRVAEPLEWVRSGIDGYDKLAAAKPAKEADAGETGPIDPIAKDAVRQLSYTAEALADALERIAAGSAVSLAETLRPILQADAHLTELIRLVPEREYGAAVREIWGREPAMVRLR